MTMQNGAAMPHWRVTGQQETNRTDATGRFVSGVLVAFTIDNGVAGSVFVPDAQYTPDNVKQLIAARVAQLTGVANLAG